MQGFILHIAKVRDEDLIVTILGETQTYTAYRFYGARHSTINIGFKIDFELEVTMKSTIPRLKDVIQLGFPWILETKKLYYWQIFVKLLHTHLKETEELEPFYFNLLDELIHKITKQNIKRAILESYVKLCEYEGRLHDEFICLLCDEPIKSEISLVRGFLVTHGKCSYSRKFVPPKIAEYFKEKTLISFNDDEVEYLWGIMSQGL